MSRGVIVTRVLVSMLVGLLLGAITTELAYQLLKRENRAPERIELIIPDGTAERVAGQPGFCKSPSGTALDPARELGQHGAENG
jgi:hypothetical protein